MDHRKKKQNIQLAGALAAVGIGIYGWHRSNHHLDIELLSSSHVNLPVSFDGYRILHISDLHNTSFGFHQQTLIKKVKQLHPDIIVISGDLLDRKRTTRNNMKKALRFILEAKRCAPICFVPGNHEATSPVYAYMKEALLKHHVHVLENSSIDLMRQGETISIIGVKDPKFYHKKRSQFFQNLTTLYQMKDTSFTILLSHRPELIDSYAAIGYDLCFCGHAHGGQIRIPGIGGLFSPNQGIFPKYTSGQYQKKNTTMYVSRGLGNSRAPLRVNNHPHLLLVTLHSCKADK